MIDPAFIHSFMLMCISSRLIRTKLVTLLSSTSSPGQTLVSPAMPLHSSTSSAGSGVYTPTKMKGLLSYTAGGRGGSRDRVGEGGRGGSRDRVGEGGRGGSHDRVGEGGRGGSCDRVAL